MVQKLMALMLALFVGLPANTCCFAALAEDEQEGCCGCCEVPDESADSTDGRTRCCCSSNDEQAPLPSMPITGGGTFDSFQPLTGWRPCDARLDVMPSRLTRLQHPAAPLRQRPAQNLPVLHCALLL
jgi:hypothetical protein